MKILTWPSPWLRMLRALPHELVVAGADAARPLRRQRFDCILFHGESQYLDEQYELLSPAQRRLPKVYLELEPPRLHPVDSRHVVADEGVIVVHVNAWNRLMWDNGRSPTRVVEPGLADPGPRYRGELARGVSLPGAGGRRSGSDLLDLVRRRVPLDERRAVDPAYRFAFHPARQESLPLELIEAMMAGTPLLALTGEHGFVDSDPGRIVETMQQLLADPALAARMGAAAREHALRRFDLQRFVAQWNEVLAAACGVPLKNAA